LPIQIKRKETSGDSGIWGGKKLPLHRGKKKRQFKIPRWKKGSELSLLYISLRPKVEQRMSLLRPGREKGIPKDPRWEEKKYDGTA